MTTRMPTSAIRRPSLPLTERDEQDLVLLRESEVRRRILASLSGDTAFSADASEAVMLHAVFKVGLTTLGEALEDQGYAEMAAQQTTETLEMRSEARRRRPTWADEPGVRGQVE
jgi:hypothetical protein